MLLFTTVLKNEPTEYVKYQIAVMVLFIDTGDCVYAYSSPTNDTNTSPADNIA
jgi:hypothetical protein